MPELPEVETIVRKLRARLCGGRIERFESFWPRQVVPDVDTVRRALVGRTIVEVERRGKFIVWRLDNETFLYIHLRMSGRFAWAKKREMKALDRGLPIGDELKHVRALWSLSTGSQAGSGTRNQRVLLFHDARKFGRIEYSDGLESLTGRLGFEPLDVGFTADTLHAVLSQTGRSLKPLLLDQSIIAGLGNIYTDEALFAAELHPLTPANKLSRVQSDRLHAAIVKVLRLAIKHNGTSIDWIYPGGRMQNHLDVYGRKGEPCVRCEATIERIVVTQRGTHICPCCQKLQSG